MPRQQRLESYAQLDFSAGMFRSVARHLIPENGLYDAINGLLDNDGSIYRRGGSSVLSTANFGSTGLRFLWDGTLFGGARTFFADSADFGVLDGAEAPVNLGGNGLTGPAQPAVLDRTMFVAGNIYAGSRKTANYSTGTVTLTNGSAIATGAGTSWSANVDPGMLLRVSGERCYVVQSVDSNTQLTLTDAYAGTTGAGKAYTLKALESTATAPYRHAQMFAVAGGRMFALDGGRAYFSNYDNPHIWTDTDYHEIPGGAQMLGAAGLGNRIFLFTTEGLWTASNLEWDLTDALGNVQHVVEAIAKDLILWSGPGIASWSGGLVVPATDGVWLIGEGILEKISKPITPLYTDYVRAGHHTGTGIVYDGHYLLPILDNSEDVVDVLVCRLDRPTKTRLGVVYPWGRLDGAGVEVSGFAQRISTTSARQPKLLGASRADTGSFIARVLDLSAILKPTAAAKNDHDGTTPYWQIETRDYATGPLNKNLVRKLRATYRMTDAATDNPMISCRYSTGGIQSTGSFWGSAFWGTGTWTDSEGAEFASAAGEAPEDDGRDPHIWKINARARYIRFRLWASKPSAELTLRGLETFIRASRKV